MSEEQGGTSIKSILIGLVSTITVAVGGLITTKLTGEDKEEVKTEVAAPAPVINITNTNQQKVQTAPAGKTVIIKEKVVPAPAPATEKKKTEEEPW
jgi:hypothetical protein